MLPSLRVTLRAAILAVILIAIIAYTIRSKKPGIKTTVVRPALDVVMISLLNFPEVRKEVRLSLTQESGLWKWAETTQRWRQESRKNFKGAPVADRKALMRQQGQRDSAYRRELADILETHQLIRLQQIKLQALGPSGAFLADGRTALRITAEQGVQFKKAAADMQNGIFQDFQEQPLESEEAATLVRLRTIHQQRKAELEKQITANILTAAQRSRLEQLRGTPVGFRVDLFQPRTLLRQLRQRLPRPVPRLLEPYTLFELVQVRPMHDLLNVTPEEVAALARCAHEWRAKEDAFYQSLHGLKAVEQAAKRAVWGVRLPKEREPLEEQMRTVLGAERFLRLRQIKWQLQGPGAVFGVEMGKEFGVTREQRVDLSRRLRDHTVAFQEMLKQASRETELDRKAIGQRFDAGHELALLSVLTSEQQRRWHAQVGGPLEASQRDALLSALSQRRNPASS